MTDVITLPGTGAGVEGPHGGPAAEHHAEGEPTGFLKWITTTDHKVIGKSYMVTSIIMFFLAGLMAMVIRAQLATPNSSLLSFHVYNEMFTMHGSLMLYLFAGPFAFGGLANYIVPLQVGAPDMAFPRLNALSYWLYLGGSITMMMGFLTAGGAADFGWVAYAPLSNAVNSPGAGPDIWIVALVLTGFSAIFTGGQPDRHDLLPPRPRHDDVPDADLHLEHAGHRDPHPDRVPGAHGRRGDAVLRPTFRHPHLLGPRWGGPGPLADTSSGSSAIRRSTSWPCPTSAS